MAVAPVGRPLKYRHIFILLDDDVLYTAASIAMFAVRLNLLSWEDKDELALAKLRLRVTLGRFRAYHRFPDEGDGLLTLKGQAPCTAWLGCRWKAAAVCQSKQPPEKRSWLVYQLRTR